MLLKSSSADYQHTLGTMASNNNNNSNCNDDANAMIRDLYPIVIDELKAASVVCASNDCTEYFNPLIHQEIPDGTNSRGKRLSVI